MNQTTKKYALGVDIGGTKCAVVIGDASASESAQGLILGKLSFPTQSERGWQCVLQDITCAADKLLCEKGVDFAELLSVGVSCGGPLDSSAGTINCPPNLPDWDNVPICDILKDHFKTPVFLQNDANACALAEWKFGAGRGLQNLVFLTFGTGMGAGLILAGRLYSGTNDMAGEVGHVRLATHGPVGYGKSGSFEGFCSGGGIARLAKDYFEENAIAFDGEITAKSVAIAAKKGNAAAKEVYNICARRLGQGLSVLVDILNPQAIIIGSIYERSSDLLESEMQRILESEALPEALGVCKILPAQLGDKIGDFASLGVALSGAAGDV